VPFTDLSTSYRLGDQITVADLPPGTHTVMVRAASGQVWRAEVYHGVATAPATTPGTHAVEAWSAEGRLLAEELTTVSQSPGDRPVIGFATSFTGQANAEIVAWLRALRCTVVQFYDWMGRYSLSTGAAASWHDPLGRPVSRPALTGLISGVRGIGAVAQAYAPVCAIDPAFAENHKDWLLYRGDGRPQSLGDLLLIADPGCPQWQRHWLENYGTAADALGFSGFHLDTYGYPRAGIDARGNPASLEAGYASFVRAVRLARPGDVLSFNQVNGVPGGFTPPPSPGFRYVEVWPPNREWRHLEGLLSRSRGQSPRQGDTLAIYPPVWTGQRSAAVRTVALTQAITTVLGAGTLMYGDAVGVLRQPYYPDHEQLHGDETCEVLAWNRFALRCRDLFTSGTDTSWHEIGDENSAVEVSWAGAVSPEPVGRALFSRVARSDSVVAVSLIDLTGSPAGSWESGTDEGTCRGATVAMLVEDPGCWRAEAAILGAADGRFRTVQLVQQTHREGVAVALTVPIVAGWTVVRFRRVAR
jgi:dextranase